MRLLVEAPLAARLRLTAFALQGALQQCGYWLERLLRRDWCTRQRTTFLDTVVALQGALQQSACLVRELE